LWQARPACGAIVTAAADGDRRERDAGGRACVATDHPRRIPAPGGDVLQRGHHRFAPESDLLDVRVGRHLAPAPRGAKIGPRCVACVAGCGHPPLRRSARASAQAAGPWETRQPTLGEGARTVVGRRAREVSLRPKRAHRRGAGSARPGGAGSTRGLRAGRTGGQRLSVWHLDPAGRRPLGSGRAHHSTSSVMPCHPGGTRPKASRTPPGRVARARGHAVAGRSRSTKTHLPGSLPRRSSGGRKLPLLGCSAHAPRLSHVVQQHPSGPADASPSAAAPGFAFRGGWGQALLESHPRSEQRPWRSGSARRRRARTRR